MCSLRQRGVGVESSKKRDIFIPPRPPANALKAFDVDSACFIFGLSTKVSSACIVFKRRRKPQEEIWITYVFASEVDCVFSSSICLWRGVTKTSSGLRSTWAARPRNETKCTTSPACLEPTNTEVLQNENDSTRKLPHTYSCAAVRDVRLGWPTYVRPKRLQFSPDSNFEPIASIFTT